MEHHQQQQSLIGKTWVSPSTIFPISFSKLVILADKHSIFLWPYCVKAPTTTWQNDKRIKNRTKHSTFFFVWTNWAFKMAWICCHFALQVNLSFIEASLKAHLPVERSHQKSAHERHPFWMSEIPGLFCSEKVSWWVLQIMQPSSCVVVIDTSHLVLRICVTGERWTLRWCCLWASISICGKKWH